MAKRETMPIMGGVLLRAIPWALLSAHEEQAQHNHSQTLNRLAERGGLGSSAAWAIINDRPWQRWNELSCERALMRRVLALAKLETERRDAEEDAA